MQQHDRLIFSFHAFPWRGHLQRVAPVLPKSLWNSEQGRRQPLVHFCLNHLLFPIPIIAPHKSLLGLLLTSLISELTFYERASVVSSANIIEKENLKHR